MSRHIGNILIYEEHDYNVDTERQKFHDLFHSLKGYNLLTTIICQNYIIK